MDVCGSTRVALGSPSGDRMHSESGPGSYKVIGPAHPCVSLSGRRTDSRPPAGAGRRRAPGALRGPPPWGSLLAIKLAGQGAGLGSSLVYGGSRSTLEFRVDFDADNLEMQVVLPAGT